MLQEILLYPHQVLMFNKELDIWVWRSEERPGVETQICRSLAVLEFMEVKLEESGKEPDRE